MRPGGVYETRGDSQIEKQITDFSNSLGLLRKSIAVPYTQASINLSESGLGEAKSQQIVQAIMKFARGTGATSDDMAGALRAINQAASKGQLYAEEWKGQFAERIVGAEKLGVESWAAVSGKGLTGTKAKADFAKSMSDGVISGDKLNIFLMELSERMDAKANVQGRLDIVSQSAESSQNRLTNLTEQRSIDTGLFQGEQLKKASAALYVAKEGFAKELEKLIPLFSDLETNATTLNTRFVELATIVLSEASKALDAGRLQELSATRSLN